MQPNHNLTHKPTQDELDWASELLKDVFCGCILNMKLRRAGLCPKYFCEMTMQGDYRQYGTVLEELLLKKS